MSLVTLFLMVCLRYLLRLAVSEALRKPGRIVRAPADRGDCVIPGSVCGRTGDGRLHALAGGEKRKDARRRGCAVLIPGAGNGELGGPAGRPYV